MAELTLDAIPQARIERAGDACPGSLEREDVSPFALMVSPRFKTCLTASLRSPYFHLTQE
jgi:hypothetical protein